ncbi:TPA: HNH endonuclease [Kluyvera ascorbata]|nr:HNH endonuclease [Kluyvera ascorbata]HDG1711489.1 HNH endonuclease [Kluyvera ascorbata]
MENLIVLVVVVWVLFKLVKVIATKLYPSDTLKAWKKYDNSQRKDVWGHYPNAEEHVGLFEQIRREQQQKQQEANNAGVFYRSKEWRRLRYQAFRKYGNKCCVCGRGASDGMVMHVDHIKPRSLHPHLALELSNLQIMCNECNVSKSNKDEVKWR